MIVQLPPPVRCTVVPTTVQLPLEENETARPELAVAATVKSGSPADLSASAPNVIVWFAFGVQEGKLNEPMRVSQFRPVVP